MKYGLNLYSVRNYLDTEENFLAAAKEKALSDRAEESAPPQSSNDTNAASDEPKGGNSSEQ